MLCANTATSFAQKLTKAERKAQKQERIDERNELIKQMYENVNFTFVPSEAIKPAQKPLVITDYQSLILKPNFLSIEMAYIPSVTTPLFTVVLNETTKNGYKMVVDTEINSIDCTLTFTTNTSTGTTRLMLTQNSWQGYTYKGVLNPN